MQAAKRKKMRKIKEKDGKWKWFTFVASTASSITSIHPSKVAYILKHDMHWRKKYKDTSQKPRIKEGGNEIWGYEHTTWRSAKKPLKELSKLTLDLIQRSPLWRQAVLLGTTAASYLTPWSSTHLKNFPPKRLTPIMLNINQNTTQTRRTLAIPGIAWNSELITT